ncbi:outer membrane beta-barrel protein [Halocola ammonii]
MRIFLLSTLFILASVFTAHSQLTFTAGVKAGAVTSQVGGDGLAGFDKFGLTGGAHVKMNWNEDWGLQMGLLFVQKGSRQIPDNEKGIFEYALKFNYLEIPITLQRDLGNFSLGGGAYAGVLISANEIRAGAEADISEAYEKQDIGVLLDGTFHLSETVFINGRVTQSILPVLPAPEGSVDPFYRSGQYHTAVQLMLGLSL